MHTLNRESRESRERSRRCNPALFVSCKERTLLAANATVSTDRDGKVAKRAGEPEDLPCQFAIGLRPLVDMYFCFEMVWGKKGCLSVVSLCDGQRAGKT